MTKVYRDYSTRFCVVFDYFANFSDFLEHISGLRTFLAKFWVTRSKLGTFLAEIQRTFLAISSEI